MATTEQNPNWNIRPYNAGDEVGLTELFARAFRRSMTVQEWLWKHHALPSPAPNVWLAEFGGKPIFHTSGIPLRYKLNGSQHVAMVSVDTMTDPDFRRRGLLTAVGKYAYDAYRAANIPFVIGIINDKWGSRAPALGWEALFPLEIQVRPLLPAAILARRANFPLLARFSFANELWNRFWDMPLRADKTIRVRAITHAGNEFDQLWQNAAPDYKFTIVRDRAWVEWRYLQEPTAKYRVLLAERDGAPLGYLAYRMLENQTRRAGLIAEIFTRRGDVKTVYTLLVHVLREWRAQQVQVAMHTAARGAWLYQTLRRVGFIASPGAFNVQLVPLTTNLPLAALQDPSNWFMAGGDFDDV